MAFFEIKQEILQKEDKKLVLRFLMDTKNNITLHSWSDVKGNIERFQLAKPGKIIEWKKSSGLFTGNVEDGESQKPGIKASPLLQFETNENSALIENFAGLIKQALKEQAASPLGPILTFVLEKIAKRG